MFSFSYLYFLSLKIKDIDQTMSEDLHFQHSTILHTLRSMVSCSSFSESKTFFLSSSTDVYKVLYPVICKRHKCRLFLNLKQMGHAGQGDKILTIQTTGKILNLITFGTFLIRLRFWEIKTN